RTVFSGALAGHSLTLAPSTRFQGVPPRRAGRLRRRTMRLGEFHVPILETCFERRRWRILPFSPPASRAALDSTQPASNVVSIPMAEPVAHISTPTDSATPPSPPHNMR